MNHWHINNTSVVAVVQPASRIALCLKGSAEFVGLYLKMRQSETQSVSYLWNGMSQMSHLFVWIQNVKGSCTFTSSDQMPNYVECETCLLNGLYGNFWY